MTKESADELVTLEETGVSDYIDTRDGWREVDTVSAEQAHHGHTLWEFRDGESLRAWVREDPVPPLPTEATTVIRVTWSDSSTNADLVKRYDGGWQHLWGDGRKWETDDGLLGHITGFEVLAQPQGVLDAAGEAFEAKLAKVRGETAKAVIDRVRRIIGVRADEGFIGEGLKVLAVDFGVGS